MKDILHKYKICTLKIKGFESYWNRFNIYKLNKYKKDIEVCLHSFNFIYFSLFFPLISFYTFCFYQPIISNNECFLAINVQQLV